MWRELVSGLFDDAKFSKPARPSDIQRVEDQLKVMLPADLKGFLLESNGLAAYYSSPLIWPTHEIIQQNRQFRDNPEFAQLYMPFDSLLFFGAEGNGDQFAYRILAGQIRDTSWIYHWDHELDNREWFADGLEDYFKRSAPAEKRDAT
jgi:hypothetical protein